LKDNKLAKKIEVELFENPIIKIWLGNLMFELSPDKQQFTNMEHGSFDICLENACLKAVQLRLHGDLNQMKEAVKYYIDTMKQTIAPYRNDKGQLYKERRFFAIVTANCLSLADIQDKSILKFMLGSLDEMFNFTKKKNYDIYMTREEEKKLKGIPKIWKNRKFINPEIIREYGFSYPLIYDIAGLHKLYVLNDPIVNKKINDVIVYISTDDFNSKIENGYGILVNPNKVYHSMGWDPKYPGWFDVVTYMENGYVPSLLFFAEYISNYPVAVKTKWFNDLQNYLDKYKTDNGTYEFPKKWLQEKTGYAVSGFHMSFGENRRKKNWAEIESTFYMQLIKYRK
jgi:hypothetical protein